VRCAGSVEGHANAGSVQGHANAGRGSVEGHANAGSVEDQMRVVWRATRCG